MTASDSSSSATNPPESGAPAPVDLLATGRLPPIPSAFLRGEHTELLEPLRFLAPGATPDGEPPAVERGALAAALGRVNESYGHPRAAALAERLAEPATRVVVTGQQAGLFGGPLYTLTKIVAAARWAERLSADGMPAVAVFWMATEDHDFDEVARATLLGRKGPVTVDLGEDPAPLMPAGMRGLGPPLADALEAARDAYPGDLAAAAWDDIARRYRPEARFGEAFSRFVVDLLGARAPLVLDSMDATVKRLQRPHLRRLVERRHALLEAQAAAHAEVEAAGLPLQVSPQPGASPLFFLHGMERRRILYPSEETYALRGLDGSEAPIARLLETIDENPTVISPGVLARPAIQDALLGTALQVLGPGEMSYMPQVTPAYRALELEAPWTVLRPQVLALETRQVEHLAELGIDLETLLETDAATLVAERLGQDLVGPARTHIGAVLQRLEEVVHELDPTLDRPYRKTADQIDRALDTLEGKVTAAVARRHDVWLKRLEKIRDQVLPGGSPQERTLAVAHFAVKHGPPFVDAMFEQLDLDPRVQQVIVV